MSRALRLAVLVAPVLLLAACEDPLPAEKPVAQPTLNLPAGQAGCGILQTNQVASLVQPPPATASPAPAASSSSSSSSSASSSGSPAAAPATPGPTPVPIGKPVPDIRTLATTFAGAPQSVLVSQCTYSGDGLASVVVTVIPAQKVGKAQFGGKISELTDYTDGATTVSIGGVSTYLQTTAQAAAISFESNGGVVSIAYRGSEPGGGESREQRLADLAAGVLHAIPPSLPPVTTAVASGSSASATPRPPAGSTVTGATAAGTVQETDKLVFAPDTVTVKAGDVVEWDNAGSAPHNVTFANQPAISSGTMSGGDKFQVKFTLPGTYSYVCTFHVSNNMIGSITVSG